MFFRVSNKQTNKQANKNILMHFIFHVLCEKKTKNDPHKKKPKTILEKKFVGSTKYFKISFLKVLNASSKLLSENCVFFFLTL